MSDLKTESALLTGEQGGQPPTPASVGNGGQRTSGNGFTQEQADALYELFKARLDADTQRIKDKRLSDYEKHRPVLEKVAKLLSPEQVAALEKDLEYEEIRARVFSAPPVQSPARDVAGIDEAARVIADSYGLSPDDPELLSITRKAQGADLVRQVVELGKYRAQAPKPTQAAAAAQAGGQQSNSEDTFAEFVKLSKNPGSNPKRFRELLEIVKAA